MLTLGKVGTGGAAATYYEEADDYYHQDRSPSRWSGEGAAALGLQGEVNAQAFRNLLDGHMPDGSRLHNAADGRRGGTDFTFSAPKSVSMQALIGGDERLVDAHEYAVARAMEYVQGLASYRVTEDGVSRSETSDKLLVASFRHDLSRALDPNLHTHAVVINATQRGDGQWRALEQGEFYRQQKLIGALYRAELAIETQKLGYEVRLTHADGRFELAHITPAQVAAYSHRGKEVEERLAAQGLDRGSASARQKEVAALATREAKTDVDRTSLREGWRESSRALGVDYGLKIAAVADRDIARQAAAMDAVAFAVAHHTERQAVVTHTQLVHAALERGTGGTDLAAIRTEIERQVETGGLIRAGERYTTAEAQQRERDILAVAERGRGAVVPMLDKPAAERALESTTLNAGQRAAAVLVVSTDERVSAIQGSAGTGKTTMLRQAHGLAEDQGYRMVGLAPSAAAVRELERAGIRSETVAAFTQRERTGIDGKSVIVLDEAGMAPARDMLRVLQQAEASGARVVLLGDVQQLKAVEAGRPFAQLQEAGVARVEMGEIQRQTDAQLRHAVELAARGDTERSLAVLERHVIEIDGYRQRHQAIAKDYVMLPAADRAQTLILAGTRAARESINDQVRAELGLAGQGLTMATLQSKDLTREQARMSLSYQAGDIVEARKAYPSLGLERGDQARVVDAGAGRVTLERADGEQVQWRPALQPHLGAYTPQQRELAPGDAVRLTANDHACGIVNGERATVLAVDAERQTITLRKADGAEISLDASRPLHLDHGYCSTVHAAQGQTAERVLFEADTKSAVANESLYYVGISRARSEVTIYTDERHLLPQMLGREDAKAAALDLAQPPADSAKRVGEIAAELM